MWHNDVMAHSQEGTLQFVTDEAGARTAVIIPIDEFEELLEDAADLAIMAERRGGPTISHAELVAELERDGLL